MPFLLKLSCSVYSKRSLNPTIQPDRPEPPGGLVAFYWHFARQVKGLFAALFVAGLFVALLDLLVPVFMGRVVGLVTSSDPARLWSESWHMLLGMAAVLLFVRPLALTAQNLIANQAISANVANMIRWQNHWYVARQSWAFFQNDFAGRIANRVLQTGPAVRELLVSLITGVWYILVYGTAALVLLASADAWLALPISVWFVGYIVLLRVLRAAHARPLEAGLRSALDADRAHRRYLHQHPDREAVRARPSRGRLCARRDRGAHRAVPRVAAAQHPVQLLPVDAQRHAGDRHRRDRDRALGSRQGRRSATVAMALPLSWQIISIAGWVAMRVTEIFENIGVVQEGMMTIARPIGLADRPDAEPLTVTRGEIKFEDVRFGYGRESGLIDGLSIDRRARRAHRPRRPLRRRQIDARQSAAALLRPRGRPHPDRWPGYRRVPPRKACARRFPW